VHRNNILIYSQQDATVHSLFYLGTALHVSGGTTTHHQERKQLYLQHLVFVTALLLPAAIAEELDLQSIFNLLTKYIDIDAYQICSCCTSSGRVNVACYRKLGKVSNTTRRNSETNTRIINQRTKLDRKKRE